MRVEDISVFQVRHLACACPIRTSDYCARKKLDSHHLVGLHLAQVWFPSEEWPSGTGHEWDGPDGVPVDPP